MGTSTSRAQTWTFFQLWPFHVIYTYIDQNINKFSNINPQYSDSFDIRLKRISKIITFPWNENFTFLSNLPLTLESYKSYKSLITFDPIINDKPYALSAKINQHPRSPLSQTNLITILNSISKTLATVNPFTRFSVCAYARVARRRAYRGQIRGQEEAEGRKKTGRRVLKDDR